MSAWKSARPVHPSRLTHSRLYWLVPAAAAVAVVLLALKWRSARDAAAARGVTRVPASVLVPAAIPPQRELAVLLFKSERMMEVWGRGSASETWRLLREFPVSQLSGGAGPKLRGGDRQIPEGSYKLKPHSLALEFPNEFDLLTARAEGRAVPTGEIGIGSKAASGQIALEEAALQDLSALIAAAGTARVLIAPNDLRKHVAVRRPGLSPPWLNGLYAQLKRELETFERAE